MNFSIGAVSVNWAAAAAYLAVVVIYAAAAVMAGRRFGLRGVLGVWIAGLVAVSLYPLVMHGESLAHLHALSILVHTAVLGVPMGISALVIARTLRRPRPVGVPVEVALGTLAFVVAFLVMTVVVIAWIATH